MVRMASTASTGPSARVSDSLQEAVSDSSPQRVSAQECSIYATRRRSVPPRAYYTLPLHPVCMSMKRERVVSTRHVYSRRAVSTPPHLLPLTTTHSHSLLLTTTHDYSLLLTTTRYYSLLLTTTHYYPPLPTTTHYYSVVLTTTHYYSLLLTTTDCY